MADTDDVFDGSDDLDGDAGSGDSGTTEPAPQGDGSDASPANSPADDRVKFWMSKAQSAEAEVNRLKGLDAKGKPKNKDAAPAGGDEGADPQARLSEFETYMRESVRNQVFGEDGRLKDFGFSLDDIAGDSPSEMRASRQRLIQVIEKAQSRATNEAFERLGIDPGVAGGSAERKDYAAMSDEEFEKEIEKAKSLPPRGF